MVTDATAYRDKACLTTDRNEQTAPELVMTHRTARTLLCIGLTAALASMTLGCEKKQDDNPADAPAADAKPAADKPAEDKGAEKPAEKEGTKPAAAADKEGDGEATGDEIPADAMEKDPAATDSIKKVDFGGKAPEGAEVNGKLQFAFGWTDKHGTNAIVAGIKESKGKSEDGKTHLLVIDHLNQEGDGSWTQVRRFRELVEDCQFDVHMAAMQGDWSITDLDKDGLGEATVAWRAGCTSDVSPDPHKVLLTENGEKYILRGQSKVDGMGGDYKADAAFKKGPEEFLKHTKMVWDKTASKSVY